MLQVPLPVAVPFDANHPTMAESFGEARIEAAAAGFADDTATWHEVIGRPTGLERYRVTNRNATEILEQYRRFASIYPDGYGSLDDAGRNELLQLLHTFGPLRPLLGVVGSPQRSLSRGMLNLEEFYNDVATTDWGRHQVEVRNTGNSEKLRRMVFEGGRNYAGYVSVVPVLTDAGVRHRVFPNALASFLWSGILESLGVWPEGRCRYCHRTFERPLKRGRPADYCEEHRTSKFRRLVSRGLTLRQELPALQGDDDA